MLFGAIILLSTLLNQTDITGVEKHNFDLGGAIAPVVESPPKVVRSVSKPPKSKVVDIAPRQAPPVRRQPVYQYYYNPYQYYDPNCVGYT
jgi:hypothetical protein